MATVTINNKEIPQTAKNKKLIHVLALGTRSNEVGATFYNSALAPFTDITVHDDGTATSAELQILRDWMASKAAGTVVHIVDEGKDSRERETILGVMVKKIDAALASYGLFKRMTAITEPVKGGITLIGKSDEGKTRTTSFEPVTSDFDLDLD
jgi:hypothetical protein